MLPECPGGDSVELVTTDSSNGREIRGYRVANLDATLTKDAAVGVNLLSQPIQTAYGRTAMVEFPGGYIAEIHEVAK